MTKQIRPNRRNFLAIGGLAVLSTTTAPWLDRAAAEPAADVAALEAKGVKFKRRKTAPSRNSMSARTHSSRWTTTGCSAGIARRCGASACAKEPALNGAVLAAVGPLPKVEQFFSNGARLLDDDFKHFAGWTGLRRFGLDHWGWFETPNKRFVGPGLAHLAVLPHLDWLRLGGCRIGNPAVEALAKIKSLQYVDLFHDQITDEGIPRTPQLAGPASHQARAAVHPADHRRLS